MAAEDASTPPPARSPARGRRRLRAVLTALAIVALAACAPRAAPHVASDPAAAAGTTDGAHPAQRRSAGCDAAPTTAPRDRLVVAGLTRTFMARVPAGPAAAPRDLVFVFHGRTNDASQMRRYVGLDAALPDAIVVYPRALPTTPGAFAWASPGDPPDRQRDFALVDALIDTVGDAHCVDLERVFVVGHSLGAYFANDVACHLGDRIRAVASVAGGLQGDGCVAGAAALLVHHPDDRLVPIAEGAQARDAFLAVHALIGVPAVAAADGPLTRLRCTRHGDADDRHPVVWCARDDATTPRGRDPHTWPAGMAAAIGAFFANLP